MSPINVVVKTFREINNDSWTRRILPLGGFVLGFSLILKLGFDFVLADPIIFGAWATYFYLWVRKHEVLERKKEKQKSKPKPPPDEFYV